MEVEALQKATPEQSGGFKRKLSETSFSLCLNGATPQTASFFRQLLRASSQAAIFSHRVDSWEEFLAERPYPGHIDEHERHYHPRNIRSQEKECSSVEGLLPP